MQLEVINSCFHTLVTPSDLYALSAASGKNALSIPSDAHSTCIAPYDIGIAVTALLVPPGGFNANTTGGYDAAQETRSPYQSSD